MTNFNNLAMGLLFLIAVVVVLLLFGVRID